MAIITPSVTYCRQQSDNNDGHYNLLAIHNAPYLLPIFIPFALEAAGLLATFTHPNHLLM
ncbi:hypothetical protein DVP68_02175 [Yersinia enterocolitica]|nr:hypothetical protein [Yersinia enterocolitica]EKN6365369.1 hypothetical protein [Yersinia enterocolitica]